MKIVPIIKVIFDKVSVTSHIVESIRLTIKSNLTDLSNSKLNNLRVRSVGSDNIDPDDYIVKNYQEKHGRYNHTYDFRVPTDTELGYFNFKVSIYPVNKAHNFIKFEFNPTKLGSTGRRKLRRLLVRILGLKRARSLFYEGRLTRLDTTVDFHRTVNNSYHYMKGVNCSELVRGADDEVESQICGSSRSNVRVTLYDKTKEQADRSRGATVDHVSRMRLEIVNRDLGFSMDEIADKLRNHFKKLSFFRDDFLADDYFDVDFLAAAQAEGLNAALSQLDGNTRKRYLRRLGQYTHEPVVLRRLSIGPGLKSLRFLS
ncbi:MAG: hypothetical protein HRU77_09810 [Gammaproteobacteria bacterium]|nr:MAG: hypothetical protein HRU77_09810 [Gammaproteobacteria bacterium]